MRAARTRESAPHSYIISGAGVARAEFGLRGAAARLGGSGPGLRSYRRPRHGIMTRFIITKLTKNPNDDAP
jgi:hypothetical protein